MRIVILGAGVVGVTSAWYLSRAGHEVTVFDRCGDVAMETSFANGGQISPGNAEPWSNPRALLQALKWLGRQDAPLRVRPRADPRQWRWLVGYVGECLRYKENMRQILNLCRYSLAELERVRTEAGIDYDQARRGILNFFTDEAEFERAALTAGLMTEQGLERRLMAADDIVAVEPAMASCRHRLVGGIYTPTDESGDCRKFTTALAERAGELGAAFRLDTRIVGLDAERGAIAGVRVRDAEPAPRRVVADAYVVALGSYSPLLLRPVGVDLPVYPVKGYSATIDTGGSDRAPRVSLTDETRKLVFSRLGDRLRVAGTAELNGYDTRLDAVRCRALVERVFDLWPEAGDRDSAVYWCGLRPSTPSNKPLIGRTRYANLFLNTGHGSLGWTMSCGSARGLADIVDGRRPEVDFSFRI